VILWQFSHFTNSSRNSASDKPGFFIRSSLLNLVHFVALGTVVEKSVRSNGWWSVFFLMLRTVLLTSHCISSFQRPTVPHAGCLLDARCGEDLLRTNNICLFYMLSAHVYLLFCETTYLSPECHTMHAFVPKELFFCFVNDSLSRNTTGN
jgi:hypothetical protein